MFEEVLLDMIRKVVRQELNELLDERLDVCLDVRMDKLLEKLPLEDIADAVSMHMDYEGIKEEILTRIGNAIENA